MVSKILVTGGSGMLGSACCVEFGSDHEVFATYREHVCSVKGVKSKRVDLLDEAALEAFFNEVKPDVVIHTAAQTNVDYCEEHPEEAEALHVGVTRKLVELCDAYQAVLVYISTDYVFDGKKGNYTEKAEAHPLNTYGKTKLAGEKVASEYAHSMVLRTSIFGISVQDKQSLAEWVLAKLKAGEKVPGFEDHELSIMLTNTLARVIREVLASDFRGLLHVGSRESVNKFVFARTVASVFGFDKSLVVPASSKDVAFKAARPTNVSLDVSLASGLLTTPLLLVEESLQEMKMLMESDYMKKIGKKGDA